MLFDLLGHRRREKLTSYIHLVDVEGITVALGDGRPGGAVESPQSPNEEIVLRQARCWTTASRLCAIRSRPLRSGNQWQKR